MVCSYGSINLLYYHVHPSTIVPYKIKQHLNNSFAVLNINGKLFYLSIIFFCYQFYINDKIGLVMPINIIDE